MKKYIILLTLSLIFIMSSCVPDQVEAIYEKNVYWTDKEETFRFNIAGINDSYGYGSLEINDENVEFVMILSHSPGRDISLLKKEHIDLIIKNGSIITIPEFLLELKTTQPKIDYFRLKTDELIITTKLNNTGDPKYDDLELHLKRYDLPEEEIDAKHFYGTVWESSSLNIELINSSESYFTKKVNGEIQVDEKTLPIYI